MTYVSPTALVAATKTLIGASAAWVAAGGTAAKIHYPDFSSGDSSTPYIVISPDEGQSRRKFMDGVQGLPSGSVDLHCYFDDAVAVGVVEKFGEDFCKEVPALNVGLTVNDASYGQAMESGPEEEAGGDAAPVITITLSYGLEG